MAYKTGTQDDRGAYLPTQDEIRSLCQWFRADWTEAEYRRRARHLRPRPIRYYPTLPTRVASALLGNSLSHILAAQSQSKR